MQHLQSVTAISDIGKHRCIGVAHGYVLRIVQRAVQGDPLVNDRAGRRGDIGNHQSVAASSDIGIGPCDEDPARIGQRDRAGRYWHWITQLGDIEQFHPLCIGYPKIAELDCACPRVSHRPHRCQLRVERIAEIDHHQPNIRRDIGYFAGQDDMPRTL